MATAGERLRLLAGTSGTAGALLLAIGAGATAGAALVAYSGLSSGTASEHLMADAARQVGHGGYGFLPEKPRKRRDEDELLFILLQ